MRNNPKEGRRREKREQRTERTPRKQKTILKVKGWGKKRYTMLTLIKRKLE